MIAARLQELQEMAEKLLASARALPSRHDHHNPLRREIERFRAQIAALKGADLRPAQGLQAKGNNVTSIVRYLETGDYGEKTGRQLIAEVDAKPRAPAARATWTADPSFDLATELLNAPSFKPVVESVLKNGYEIVEIGRKLKK